MKTFLFGGSLKSVVDQVCEKFDVKLKINSVENVGSDFEFEYFSFVWLKISIQ